MIAPQTSPPRRRIGPLRLLVGALILLITLGFWGMLMLGNVRAFIVESGSMEPTLIVGDRLFVKAFVEGAPYRGQLVVLDPPDDDGAELVKRVVAIPGDRITFRDKRFYVNDAPSPPPGNVVNLHPGAKDREFFLQQDEYYVLGDNRPKSFDSEEFGPVHRKLINGIVVYRYWPRARIGKVR